MKTLFTALALATTCCLAAEVAYTPAGSKAQGALLVLPLKQANNNTSTTPRSVSGTDNLEEVNAKIFDKLKQEQGSQQGEYHVYLQDGRLQKVQYITAPITSGQQAQQQQYVSNNNYNQQQQQQTPEILSTEYAEKRGVYFVQVPEERIQAFQNYARQTSKVSQAPSSPSQYRQELASEIPVVRYLPVPLSDEYRRAEEASEQQAVLQYSEVQPIRGPVYSYSPQAITRILRYAPEY